MLFLSVSSKTEQKNSFLCKNTLASNSKKANKNQLHLSLRRINTYVKHCCYIQHNFELTWLHCFLSAKRPKIAYRKCNLIRILLNQLCSVYTIKYQQQLCCHKNSCFFVTLQHSHTVLCASSNGHFTSAKRLKWPQLNNKRGRRRRRWVILISGESPQKGTPKKRSLSAQQNISFTPHTIKMTRHPL